MAHCHTGVLCNVPVYSPMQARGGLLRLEPSHTSSPLSQAAKAWLPVTPLLTQVRLVSRMPCMKNTTWGGKGGGQENSEGMGTEKKRVVPC